LALRCHGRLKRFGFFLIARPKPGNIPWWHGKTLDGSSAFVKPLAEDF
jgi:hypothetical protein